MTLGYDASTGDLFVDVPMGTELSSLKIDSVAGIFTGSDAENLGGSFDSESNHRIFKAFSAVALVPLALATSRKLASAASFF